MRRLLNRIPSTFAPGGGNTHTPCATLFPRGRHGEALTPTQLNASPPTTSTSPIALALSQPPTSLFSSSSFFDDIISSTRSFPFAAQIDSGSPPTRSHATGHVVACIRPLSGARSMGFWSRNEPVKEEEQTTTTTTTAATSTTEEQETDVLEAESIDEYNSSNNNDDNTQDELDNDVNNTKAKRLRSLNDLVSFDDAKNALEEYLEEHRNAPHQGRYNIVWQKCETAEQFHVAVSLLTKVQHRVVTIEHHSFNRMFAAAKRTDQIDILVSLLKQPQSYRIFPSRNAFIKLIRHYGMKGQPEVVEDLWKMMERRQIPFNREAYMSRIVALALKNHRWPAAWEAAQQARELGHEPSRFVCASLLDCSVRNKEAEKAQQYWEELEQRFNWASAEMLANGVVLRLLQNQPEQATALYEKAVQLDQQAAPQHLARIALRLVGGATPFVVDHVTMLLKEVSEPQVREALAQWANEQTQNTTDGEGPTVGVDGEQSEEQQQQQQQQQS